MVYMLTIVVLISNERSDYLIRLRTEIGPTLAD